MELVKKQHRKAEQILAADREKLDQLAAYLYEKETITGEEFMNILNSRSSIHRDASEKYVCRGETSDV